MLSVQLGPRELICVSINQGRPKRGGGGNGNRSGRSPLRFAAEPGALTLFYFGDWGKNSFP